MLGDLIWLPLSSGLSVPIGGQVVDPAAPSRPFLMGFRGAEPEAGLLLTPDLVARVGFNTGNLAFCQAILSHLGEGTVNRHWSDPDSSFSGLGSVAVLPMSNQLGSHTDLGSSCDRWNRIPQRLVAIGLGAQSAIGDVGLTLPEGTLRFLQLLRERAPGDAPNVALRGQFSAEVLARAGFSDLGVPLGCPSLFLNPEPGLGAVLAARQAVRPRHIAVCGGHHQWHHLAWIERRLVALLEACGGPYICQSPLEMVQACRGDWSSLAPEVREEIRAYLGLADERQADDWFFAHGVAYSSVPEWMSQLRKVDFVVGTRFHGVMLALQVGCPALCIVHDSRTLELCQTMQVPWVIASDLPGEFSLDDLLDAARLDAVAFDDNRRALARRYDRFLRSNGIEPVAWLAQIGA